MLLVQGLCFFLWNQLRSRVMAEGEIYGTESFGCLLHKERNRLLGIIQLWFYGVPGGTDRTKLCSAEACTWDLTRRDRQ